MTTLNFTLAQIEKMITKGTGRTLKVSESAKMLKDIKGMTEKQANTYLSLWSNIQWYNRLGGNRVSRRNRMEVVVSCKMNAYAYINFLIQDVANTK